MTRPHHRRMTAGAGVIALLLAAAACTTPQYTVEYPPQMEAWYGGLTPDQRDGLDTWYRWTAGDEKLFRYLAMYTEGRADFLKMAMRPRATRFQDLGAINSPDCTARTQPDEYGLTLDECEDPNDSGILGLRKFQNPKFEAAKWRSAGGYEGYKKDADLEPPYLVGASCGICHIALNPIAPPSNPNEPDWENVLPAFGNQYIRESALFASASGEAEESRFVFQVLKSQPPGTSDTSRMATDHIDNPNVINPIQGLAHRPRHREQMGVAAPLRPGQPAPLALISAHEGMKEVHHVLKDGADSIGLAGASLRVYVNIGMCADFWLPHHDLIYGRTRPQRPFDIETARANCYDWKATEKRLGNVEAFLKTQGPLRLAAAPGGSRFISPDRGQLLRGATVFAGSCARCHSSTAPPGIEDKHAEAATAAWVDFVAGDVEHFLENNYLSDDWPYPVASRDDRLTIGTNAARTMGTNATEGQIYAQFSSKSYKDRPAVGGVNGLFNPFTGKNDLSFDIPAGGRGYYRTPSLISIWATAPFLHNNSLGTFTQDPSVAGRIDAFNDAAEKLLWPAKRDNLRSIKLTDRDTLLEVSPKVGNADNVELPIRKGTPIKLVANIHLPTLLAQATPELRAKLQELSPEQFGSLALKFNQVPDFVEDRGHTFGAALSDDDKRALIEFLKTL